MNHQSCYWVLGPVGTEINHKSCYWVLGPVVTEINNRAIKIYEYDCKYNYLENECNQLRL